MLTLYFPQGDLKSQLYNDTSYVQGVSGRVAHFSQAYIELMFLFYRFFGWGIRQITGWMEDFWKQRDIDLPVPSFGHLCDLFTLLDITVKQRCTKLSTRLKHVEKFSLIVDSTGMRTESSGEWYQHKYNRNTRRKGWAKFHLAIDPEGNCLAVEITSEEIGDSPILDQFLERNIPLGKIIADGAYYQIERNQKLIGLGIVPVIPPKKEAVVHGTSGYEYHDLTVQYIQDKGSIYAWQKKQGYGIRSRIEAQFSRIKRCIGSNLLTKRTASRKNEGIAMANLINIWNSFGKCQTMKIA